MNKTLLWDAERLAQFSNAKTLREVESFRRLNQDFLPEMFWTRTVPYDPLDALVPCHPRDTTTALVNDTEMHGILARGEPETVPYWWRFQQGVRAAWEDRFPLEFSLILINFAPLLDETGPPSVWPYQRAVMFLFVEPWRALFCGQCGMRFVADKPARRFCSSKCSTKARQASRAAAWAKHGKKWRTRYQRRARIRKRDKEPKQ